MGYHVWIRSAKLWAPVLKRAWGWLLFSMIVEESFTYAVGSISKSDERTYIVGGILALFLQLILSAVGIVIINQMVWDDLKQMRSKVFESLNRNLKYVFIESTRALLPVLLKSLLLVIPGFIEGIRLYFVPYIAQFDQAYKKGQVDALQRSRALVNQRFFPVMGVLAVTFILSIVPRLYLESIDISTKPVYYIFIFAFCLSVELYGDIVLFFTYIRLEELHGDPLSLR